MEDCCFYQQIRYPPGSLCRSSPVHRIALMSSFKHRQFPLWHYLNQPIFSPTVKLILNPVRFGKVYRIQYLERCWYRDCEHRGRPRY